MVVKKCWGIIAQLRGVFELEALNEFLHLAFDVEMMEIYANLPDSNEEISKFHKKLAAEMFEAGN